MNYKAVLNGCDATVAYQAGELNGFINTCLDPGIHAGGTILFYSADDEKDELSSLAPTERVELVRVDRFRTEARLAALEQIEGPDDTQLYLFPSGIMGSELAVRWAYRRKGSSLTNVQQIKCVGRVLVAEKTVYAGHVSARFDLSRAPFCLSLTRGCVENHPVEQRGEKIVVEHDPSDVKSDYRVEDMAWFPEENENDLEDTRFLVVGGRGIQNKEDAENLKALAGAMGAEFGVSRPVAMNAWVPMNRLVGVSGAITKPDICIAAGVSGAAAFYAGVQKAKTIIAVNTDGRAPIVKASDVAVIDDYRPVMAALAEIIETVD